MVSNCPQCQIVLGVKLSAMSNCPITDNPPRPYIRLYTDFTNFTDKLKTEFLISWAAWTVVRWGPQRDCGRAWWGENSRCKTNSISKKIFFLHLRFILTSTNIVALSLGWLRNHGLWRILRDDDDLTALVRNNSRKDKSISRRRSVNCWHRNDFNTCNPNSNTKKQQGKSQYRILIFLGRVDFCCWD